MEAVGTLEQSLGMNAQYGAQVRGYSRGQCSNCMLQTNRKTAHEAMEWLG